MIVNSINLDCNCNVDGSTSLQCKEDGSCDCNKYIDGDKCDQCMEQHYNFPTCSSNIQIRLVTLRLIRLF